MADNIVIKVDLDTGNTTQTFNRIESGAKKSGQKAGSNFSNEFSKSLGGLAKTAAKLSSIIGGIAGAFTFAKSIKAAQVQEDAVNRLNSALAQTGKFSAETSKELQDFAASLQDVTKFGDEAIISAQGLIQSLGNLSKNQLKDATKATLDLASALRIDLDTAARLVGKAATGNTDAFSRYGIQIQKTGDQARDFANVLGLIEQKFGGRAQQEALTFSGLIARISNNFGDLLESFGAFITQNPFVIKALSEINTILKQSIVSVTNFIKSIDTFNDIIDPLLNFNRGFIQYVIAPIELAGNVGKAVFDLFVASIAQVTAAFGRLGGIAGKALSIFGAGGGLSQALIDFQETSKQTADELTQGFQNSFNSILDFPLADRLATKNEELRAGLLEFNNSIVQSNDIVNQSIEDTVQKQTGWFEQLKGLYAETSISFNNMAINFAEQSKAISGIIKGALVQGISGGIQNIVTSIMKGEDAFANFGKFILNTFGDLAIQLGQFFIAQGIAVTALQKVQGTGAIAAGAALVALGSILKNAGGSGSSPAGGGGGLASGQLVTPSGIPTESTLPDQMERTRPSTNVEVVVQGTLVQQSELGKFIADTLTEVGDRDGVGVRTRYA
jgi:hypothetical protein